MFTLKLIGNGKGQLANDSDPDPNAPVYVFTRSAY
jgi:hypothetical protein